MTPAAGTRRSSVSPTRALAQLAGAKARFGQDEAVAKLEWLRILESARFRSASQVLLLHEVLCFEYAYPDNPDVFAQVERMLQAFPGRADLRQFRGTFKNSGLAGTDIVYPFGASTARWLTERWGDQLTVAWDEGENQAALATRLPLLTLWSERAVFDEPPLALRPWIDRLRGTETDAAFLVRRSAAATGTSLLGDQLYDELGLTLRLSPGPDSPARTSARVPGHPVVCQAAPLRTGRLDPQVAALDPPRRVADVSRRDGVRLIDLARESMVTRKRDLYSFAAADPADVRLIDCGEGFEFVCYGVHHDQRLLLDAVYGFLMLRNGVPVGYALASALWRSSEIAFNVFDTYRGAEAGWIYGRLLAIMRSLFSVDTFTVYPYQLGHENEEGLESGAWWFYYKMGFRPKDPAVLALARREAERVSRRPSYRTSLSTLKQLVRANLFLHLDQPRSDVIGVIQTDRIALRATAFVQGRFGSDRERAAGVLADEAAEQFDAASWRQWPAGKRLFWERWAPLLALLPGVDRWSPDDRHALVDVVRAKGGRRESDYVARFDAHPGLGAALVSLAAG